MNSKTDAESLDSFQQWMVKNNLQRIASGTPAEQVIEGLRYYGYSKVAAAVEAGVYQGLDS